jgi:protein tyrosine/serine phosphatase
VAYDLSKPFGRFMAYINMQLEDHGIVRSIYNNFFALPGGMYRCSQPSPAQIRKYYREFGIRTIINLRGENPHGSYDLEVATCRELGIALIDFNLYSRDMPSVEEVVGARDLFQSIAYPALMHCKSGADRAGLGATFYRHFRLGEPIGEIRELLPKYGHFTIARTAILDYFLHSYVEDNAKKPIEFITWVQTCYDQKALTERFDKGGSGLGNWIVDKVLRRE